MKTREPVHDPGIHGVQAGRLRLTGDSVDGRKRHLMFLGANGLAGDCGPVP